VHAFSTFLIAYGCTTFGFQIVILYIYIALMLGKDPRDANNVYSVCCGAVHTLLTYAYVFMFVHYDAKYEFNCLFVFIYSLTT